MAFDQLGFEPKTQTQLSDRALFALDLAEHANEQYGEQSSPQKCALARFFGGKHHYSIAEVTARKGWRSPFMFIYDHFPRQPTGFDCLAILNSIP